MARFTSAAPGAVASWRAEPQPSAIHLDRRHPGRLAVDREGVQLRHRSRHRHGAAGRRRTGVHLRLPVGSPGRRRRCRRHARGDLQHALRPLNAARIRNSTGGTQHAIHPLPGSRGRRPVHGGLLQLHQRKRYAAGARHAVGPGAAAQLLPGAAGGERAEQILLSVLAEGACGRAAPGAAARRPATGRRPRAPAARAGLGTPAEAGLRGHRQRRGVAVQERPGRRAGGGRQPAGAGAGLRAGALEHQRGARRLVPESLAGAAQKVLRELVGDLRLE